MPLLRKAGSAGSQHATVGRLKYTPLVRPARGGLGRVFWGYATIGRRKKPHFGAHLIHIRNISNTKGKRGRKNHANTWFLKKNRTTVRLKNRANRKQGKGDCASPPPPPPGAPKKGHPPPPRGRTPATFFSPPPPPHKGADALHLLFRSTSVPQPPYSYFEVVRLSVPPTHVRSSGNKTQRALLSSLVTLRYKRPLCLVALSHSLPQNACSYFEAQKIVNMLEIL